MPALIARESETELLLDHVCKQRSVLVLGRGGIGKSALLEHVAKESILSSLDHLEFGFGCDISVLSAAWPESR